MLRSACCCCCQLRVTIGTINSSSLPNYNLCNCSFSFPGPTSCLVREKPSPCLVTQSKQQVPLHNHHAVLTPRSVPASTTSHNAVISPAAAQVYYPTGLTASRLAACVCENIPPSTKKSIQGAFVFTTRRPNPAERLPRLVDDPRRLILLLHGREGRTLCQGFVSLGLL